MRWIVAGFLLLMLIALIPLTRALVINALAIRRDLNTRFNALRTSLERDANSVLDDFLSGNHAHKVHSNPGGDSNGQLT